MENNCVNMYPEILEAIHLIYEDIPEIEVDCLLYLSKLRHNTNKVEQLANEAEIRLEKMGKCPICGEDFQVFKYKEPHPELDGCPMEDMVELYCPNCDIGADSI